MSPTVREICAMVDMKTTGTVQGVINRLVALGCITKQTNVARSIKLAAADSSYVGVSYVPVLRKLGPHNHDNLLSMYNIECYIPLPDISIPNSKNIFVVTVRNINLLQCCTLPDIDVLIIEKLDNIDSIDTSDIIIAIHNASTIICYCKELNDNFSDTKLSLGVYNKQHLKIDDKNVTIIGRVIGRYSPHVVCAL